MLFLFNNMKNIRIFLLYFLFNIYLSIYIYNPKEIFDYLNKEITSKETLEFIKEKISQTFEDAYAFNQIAKDPPQPDFDSNYYNKVDIQKEIKKINTYNKTFYNFYQDLKEVLARLKDDHISIDFYNYFPIMKKLSFYDPIDLYIKLDINGKPKVFGKQYLNQTLKNHFKNNETVFKIIDNNLNIPIKSINEEDPIDYINNYGSKYYALKNVHGNFVKKLYMHNKVNLNFLPLSYKELINFTVVYENGEKFVTDFILSSETDVLPNITQNIFFIEDEIKDNELIDNKQFDMNKYFGVEEKNNIHLEKNIDILRWDYHYTDVFKCRVDYENKVNVYFVSSFQMNLTLGYTIIAKCAILFERNNYPIIVINSVNAGGKVFFAQTFLELLSQHTTVNIYLALRKTDILKNNFKEFVSNIYTCKKMHFKEFLRNGEQINYGNGISDLLTSPFINHGKEIRKEINRIKNILTNPRKPTDIIVFTDGYSYSATSIFFKYLQNNGGGIVVGYFGNPNKPDVPFDSSMSPSIIYKNKDLEILSPNGFSKLNEQFNITMQITGKQTFNNPYDINIPLEYTINPVDEKIEVYEFYNDSNYDTFIKEAKKIFKKYETKCNPKNKKLLLLSKECDKYFANKYTHGGYECGDNGEWSNKCVPSYCDKGYIFDNFNKKCLIDYCSFEDKNDINKKNNEKNSKISSASLYNKNNIKKNLKHCQKHKNLKICRIWKKWNKFKKLKARMKF